MKESKYRENEAYCYFHPKEVFVGVCPLCLNERLLILTAKQGLKNYNFSYKLLPSRTYHKIRSCSLLYKSKPSISHLPNKIFALGSLLRHRSRNNSHLHHRHCDSTSTSLGDESFISIKFGDNGVASWDKNSATPNTMSKVSLKQCSMSLASQTSVKHGTSNNTTSKSVVDHTKPRASLRWRKRIGHILQVIRWKRSNKANVRGRGSNENAIKLVVKSNKL